MLHAAFDFDKTKWVVWANTHFATMFLSLSFLVPSSHSQVAPVDRFWRSMCHMTPFCARLCLLWITLKCLSILVSNTSKPPKSSSSQIHKTLNWHIMEINALINQLLHNDKECGWFKHACNKSKIAMADNRHLEKATNHYIWATMWLIAMKFDMMLQFDPLHPTGC